MLTAHAIWTGNRQPPYEQNCGTLKDDASCTMIVLCLHLKFCCAYQVIMELDDSSNIIADEI